MSYSAISFYVVAHEDDWELFRGEIAYDDARSSNNKIVFIHTTAGDAGLTDGWWEARERGAVEAVRSALNPNPLTIHIQKINRHLLQRYVCANTVMYFMRLPDGNPSGTGYPSTNYQSLAQLRDSDKRITAVDGSTTYVKWSDFCTTLLQITKFERRGISQANPWINVSDYSSTLNPGDHADHKATADAIKSFAASNQFNRAWFLTYCIAAHPENLSGDSLDNKKKLFYTYSDEVLRVTTLDGNPVGPCDQEWSDWGARSYVRVIPYNRPDSDNPSPPAGWLDTARRGAFVDAVNHPTHAKPPRSRSS